MTSFGQQIVNFTLSKLFFPRVVTIDKPGLFYSETCKKYGSTKSRKRQVWIFNDIIVQLQLETIQSLGKKTAAFLWYQIGKDVGSKYIVLSNSKKIPAFLLPSVIEYICNALKSAGFSAFDSVEYNSKDNSLVLEGKNSIICRKTGQGDMLAGLISGIVSSLIHENIEAKTACVDCPNHCKIIANRTIPLKYIPVQDEITPIKNYDLLNFPKELDDARTDLYSFSDLLKFKRASILPDGKFNLDKFAISPTTIDFLGLIASRYAAIGKQDILDKSIVSVSREVAKTLLNQKSSSENLKAAQIILSALGFGLVNFSKQKNTVTFMALYPPISKYEPKFEAQMVKGFLQQIFNHDFKIKKIEQHISPTYLKVVYA